MIVIVFVDELGGSIEYNAHLHQHRHCERSEAIQTVTSEGLWIASLRSQ